MRLTTTLFKLTVTLLSIFTPAVASATTVIPSDLHSLVRRSGYVFAGTVSSARSEKVGGGIVTRITFGDLAFVKGNRQGGEITLTVAGGKVGTKEVFAMEMPVFMVGNRYIVLAHHHLGHRENSFNPLVGLFQGYFRVTEDKLVKRPVILDWKGRQVVGVQGHSLVVSSGSASGGGKSGAEAVTVTGKVRILPPGLDDGKRASEREFLNALRLLAAQEE